MIRTLRIQLTEECNLNCVYCCHEVTKSEFSILKNRNICAFIRASHDALGINRVKFTGGEPLEYDENICDLIRQVNRPNIQYSLVTNSTHYDSFVNLINNCPNIEITISIPIPPNTNHLSTYKNITGSINEKAEFDNVLSCISYMVQKNIPFKINYVLCKNMNTSPENIKEMILYAKAHPSIQVRFLETAINCTNNQGGRMEKFAFTQGEFEKILDFLGYKVSVLNKIEDKRSSCIYDIEGCNIKLIKFFCNNNCHICPEDKTSIWLTSTGEIKQCSYRIISHPIDNWQYNKITKQLERIFC